MTVRAAIPIMISIAIRYRGAELSGKKYGDMMLPQWPNTLTIAAEAARFSGEEDNVDRAQA